MKIPKYIEKKIYDRAMAQRKASCLQGEIEEWCEKHNVELEYNISHICLFTEPDMVAIDTIERIKKANVERQAE